MCLLTFCQSLFHSCRLAPVALVHLPCFLAENTTLNSIWSCSTLGLISRQRLVQHSIFLPPTSMLGPIQPCGSLQGREHEMGNKLDTKACWCFVQKNWQAWLPVLSCQYCCCYDGYYSGWWCCYTSHYIFSTDYEPRIVQKTSHIFSQLTSISPLK
jgi:hypothetical protein